MVYWTAEKTATVSGLQAILYMFCRFSKDIATWVSLGLDRALRRRLVFVRRKFRLMLSLALKRFTLFVAASWEGTVSNSNELRSGKV